MTFYDEEQMILDEFRHVQTPPSILEGIKNIEEIAKKKKYNQFEYSFSFRPSEIEFVQDSLSYKDTVHEACEMPSFNGYYCTFSTMNEEQKNWYFYWRERFVNGDYVHTHLSYIYVFVYELINYSFNSNAAFNVSMLIRLYEAYKDKYRIDRYNYLIADMLLEMGEEEIANKWNPYKEDLPELYTELQTKTGGELSRISVNTWKGYAKDNRQTLYFKKNRNKVYKTVKECLPILEEIYIEQGENLLDLYFDSKKVTRTRYLYSGMIVFREEQKSVPFEVTVVLPTKKIVDDMTAYFRLSENVTRLIYGETKLLPMEENSLPLNLQDRMMSYLTIPAEKGRFKPVKQKGASQRGSLIPPKEEERPVVVIEFNDERIKQLQDETEHLVEEVEKRANEYDEEIEEVVIEDSIVEPQVSNAIKVEEPEVVSGALENFFTSSADDIDEEMVEEFIDSLEAIEMAFIANFIDLEYDKQEAIGFLKTKGKMLGVILNAINEKAQLHLEENFLEEQGDTLVILEEFEQVLLQVKERV